MENSTLTACTLVDQASKTVYGAQTEIVMFIFAFGIHALFFGKFRVRSKKAPPKGATPLVTPSRSPHAKQFAQQAERYCEFKDEDKLAADLLVKMQQVPAADTVDALASLLEGAGKSVTPQLLAAVRGVMHQLDVKVNPDLGEYLLRSYFGLKLQQEFDEVHRELTRIHGELPSIGILALKASLRDCNVGACLDRMECLRPLWSKDSPSPRPVALLQQLARLMMQEQALPQLLKRLQEMDLLRDTLDVVLVESVQRGTAPDVKAVLECSRAHGGQFGEAAYCALIQNARNPSEALSLFTEAIATMKTPGKGILTVASEWALGHDDTSLAAAILQKLPANPPAEAVGKLLRLQSTDSTVALQMFEEKFQGVDLSVDIPAMQLITEAALEKHGQTGGKIIKRLLAVTTETAQVTLLKSLASKKQLLAALAVMRASPQKSTCLYNAAIDACIDCHSINDAKEVMSEVVQSGFADTITYNTIVKAYLQAKRPREARHAIAEMKAAGLRPNCVTFNELLDAVVKTSIEDAWPILEEMRASGTWPNRITCAILLKAVQARTKPADVERVIAVLDEIDEDLDEVLLCSVVDACIRAGRPELLMPQLKRYGGIVVKGAHTYGSIIRAHGFVRDVAGVWETWRMMRTRHIMANAVTLGCMTEALVTNGETEAAYELINEMLKDDEWRPLVNAVIYCSVLKGFSHQKSFGRLWVVYQEMLDLGLQFSIVTFNTLVDACSRNHEMLRIPALLKDMIAQGIPPNIITYSAILKGYTQENRIEEAFAVVESMIQTTSFRPDEIMFNTLLDGCARQGLYEKGIKVLDDMQRANIVPTNFTLSVLVKLASRSKKLEKAFELCQEISVNHRFRLNVHVYSNLMSACITNKDLNRAMDVLEQMLSDRVRPDSRGYAILVRAFLASGKANEAAGLVRAAVGLDGAHPRLARYDRRIMQPQGGLPSTLFTEVLEGIAGLCRNEGLAVELMRELRGCSHVKLDSRVQLRLATSALKR